MVSIRDRLKMAWAAFRCKPFELYIEPYHRVNGLKKGLPCDNKDRAQSSRWGCQGEATVCMSRTLAELDIRQDYDHEHLCEDCAKEIEGKY